MPESFHEKRKIEGTSGTNCSTPSSSPFCPMPDFTESWFRAGGKGGGGTESDSMEEMQPL